MEKPLFDNMKNGYNRYQVDDYLNELELQVSMLKQKAETYEQRNEDIEKQLKAIVKRYHFITDGLSAKEKAADEMTRMAVKEANMVVETAQHNADVIVKEALMMARTILLDIAKLGNEATELKGTMNEQVQALSRALDEFEVPPMPDMDLLNRKNED